MEANRWPWSGVPGTCLYELQSRPPFTTLLHYLFGTFLLRTLSTLKLEDLKRGTYTEPPHHTYYRSEYLFNSLIDIDKLLNRL